MRSGLFVLTIAVWLTATLVVVSPSLAQREGVVWRIDLKVLCPGHARGLAYFRGETWKYQRRLGVPLAKIPRGERTLSTCDDVAPFLARWRRLSHVYWKRIIDYEKQARLVGDWRSAVTYVQRWFPGTARWLMDCSSSEGGHGKWVPNRHGSGAGGWMQYMSSTFYGDYHQAVAHLARKGVRVPSWAESWYSPLGQAIAAGWARFTGHAPPGKWTGALC